MNTLRHYEGVELTDDDMRRKFAGTFVYALINGSKKASKEPLVICVSDFTHDSQDNLMAFCRFNGTNGINLKPENIEIIMDFPKCGWFNFDGDALYLERSPARQWAVGACRGNSYITRMPKQSMNQVLPSHAVWTAAFGEQKQRSLKQSLSEIKGGSLGVALNRDYAIKKSNDGILLFHRTIPIASFERTRFFMYHNTSWFIPELEVDFKGEYNEYFKK